MKGRTRSRVFESSMPRRMFGPKREEVRSRRRLHNEELLICMLHQILLA
jgi:hypothetical protein